jgi:hypothetical protein
MPRKITFISLAIFLIPLAIYAAFSVAPYPIAITNGIRVEVNLAPGAANLPNFKSFVAGLKNGQTDLAGIYASGNFAYKIVQQPSDNPAFVSTQPNTVTQFRMAGSFRTIGLLGHDYLAGGSFFNLKKNQDIILVNGNGSTRYFRIYDIQKYQALTPESPYSQFIDLANQQKISVDELFNRIYAKGNILVLQTCISTEKVPSWGRIFVLAQPVNHLTPTFDQLTPAISSALHGLHQVLQPSNKVPNLIKRGIIAH